LLENLLTPTDPLSLQDASPGQDSENASKMVGSLPKVGRVRVLSQIKNKDDIFLQIPTFGRSDAEFGRADTIATQYINNNTRRVSESLKNDAKDEANENLESQVIRLPQSQNQDELSFQKQAKHSTFCLESPIADVKIFQEEHIPILTFQK